MNISVVAAIGENFELGAKGDLLWRLPNDMKRFKEITIRHHVLMGRKTYDSIPPKFRPLPERVNIVVTTNPNFIAEGCVVVSSVLEGIDFAANAGENDLMIIGGAQVYNHALPFAHTLYITKVHSSFPDADVYFPKWNDEKWNTESCEVFQADEKHLYDYTFVKLNRI